MTFDVREFARTARGSHRAELDLEALTPADLDADAARLVRTMRDLERHTMERMRNLLVTATHKDARVTAFLTTWAFEKFWIADALDAVIEANDETLALAQAQISTHGEHTIRESIVGNIIGVPMTAVHMTVGTVDEWLMQAAYARIAELEPHPELQRTIERLLGVKERQLLFFEAQARYRLLFSRRARSITRRRLRSTPWPIGRLAQPKPETAFFFERLIASSPATVTALDARIDTLPGQSGLSLIRKASRA